MRGVPGSGKSTKAKKISNGSGLIFSTDDFFIVKGEYIYDPKMIGQYHEQNFERTLKAMKEATPLIIIDNTNVKLWEMKKYVEAADQNGYHVQIEEPETQWAWNHKICSKKNSHGVPEDKIKIMIDNFQTFKALDEIREAK